MVHIASEIQDGTEIIRMGFSAPEGVYFYTITFVTNCYQEITHKGTVRSADKYKKLAWISLKTITIPLSLFIRQIITLH
mgnify:CR=1 FL=1